MPLFKLRCTLCARLQQRLASGVQDLAGMGCGACGGPLQRAPEGPAAAAVERLDNGAMIRVVERYADAERLFDDRRKSADPMAGGRIRTGET